ncbi:MAG: hypothetical protein JO033_24925 [Acidobacteriaceae bacterium]|nr:hypothetical protein [Acidobacteriaceae bacterium]
MVYHVRLLVITAVLLSILVPDGAFAQKKLYKLCVRYYHTLNLSNAQVDEVFAAASSLLRKQTDPACKEVSLIRDGDAKPFSMEYGAGVGGQGSLDSPDSFDALQKDSCIKIVTELTDCGGIILTSDGQGLGCAPIGGAGVGSAPIVVWDYGARTDEPPGWDNAIAPILWTHEFGHTLGILHTNRPGDVMYPKLWPPNFQPNPATNVLNSSECETYDNPHIMRIVLRGQSAALGASPKEELAEAGSDTDTSKVSQAPLPLEEFVKLPPAATPSWEQQAKSYSSQVHEAERMLSDPKYEQNRSNIIALLGVIGTPDTIHILKTILKTPVTGTPSSADINARIAAPIAIGRIANRYHLPEQDIHFLRAATTTQYWKMLFASAAVGSSTAPQDKTPPSLPANGPESHDHPLTRQQINARARQLAIVSTKGYAISGSPDVAAYLQRRESQSVQAAVAANKYVGDTAAIQNAIKLNKISSDKGADTIFNANE